MIILRDTFPIIDASTEHVTLLNTLWIGRAQTPLTLPMADYLFIVFPLGAGQLMINRKRLTPEHYLYLNQPTETPYTLRQLSGDDQSETMVLCVASGFVADMADFLGIPAQFSELLHMIPLPQGDLMSDLLQSLSQTTHLADADDLFLDVVGQVLNLLRLRHQAVLSLSQHKRVTITELAPRLLQARQFIDTHYLQAIKTEDVAQQVALSEYHFARLFKSAFDMTVHQYVMRLRFGEARRLLEFSDIRVTDIALEVGYQSLSAFIHAFRKDCGVSPSAYRAKLKTV